MKTSDILRRSLEVLRTYGWAQGNWAYDHRGMTVFASAPDAVKFCAIGSIYKTLNTDVLSDEASRAVNCLESQMPSRESLQDPDFHEFDGAADYNDAVGRTFEEIVVWFNKSITQAELMELARG